MPIDSLSSLNTNLTADGTPFRFGKDADGNYGYIITDEAGADSVVPFKGINPVLINKINMSTSTITVDGKPGDIILASFASANSESSSGISYNSEVIIKSGCEMITSSITYFESSAYNANGTYTFRNTIALMKMTSDTCSFSLRSNGGRCCSIYKL